MVQSQVRIVVLYRSSRPCSILTWSFLIVTSNLKRTSILLLFYIKVFLNHSCSALVLKSAGKICWMWTFFCSLRLGTQQSQLSFLLPCWDLYGHFAISNQTNAMSIMLSCARKRYLGQLFTPVVHLSAGQVNLYTLSLEMETARLLEDILCLLIL